MNIKPIALTSLTEGALRESLFGSEPQRQVKVQVGHFRPVTVRAESKIMIRPQQAQLTEACARIAVESGGRPQRFNSLREALQHLNSLS